MFSILVLLFTVIPAIEIYLLFSIGSQIGGLNTLLVVILTGVVGASLAKSQGLSILAKVQNDLQQGAVPTGQFIHGLLVFGGGLLLLTPGFLTDILGLSMVFPATRFFYAAYLKHLFAKGIANGSVHFSSYDFSSFSRGADQQRYEFHEHHSQGPRQVGPDVFEAEYKKKD
jgi:UPF0716 protein FxsA